VRRPQHALVGDEHVAHAELRRAAAVLQALSQLIASACPRPRPAADRACGRADVPCAARAEEERDLDLTRQIEHRRDVSVGEHHHAAALADAVDRHAERRRLFEHGLQGVRPFDRRDLDPPRAAVREALLRRRGARLRDVEPEPAQRRFSGQWLHVLLLHVNRRTFQDRGGSS